VRENLIIRLGPTEQVTWLTQSEPTRVWGGTLAEAAAAAAGRQVTVVVPGTDVILTRVAVPTRNRSRMAAAVPYLLEEQLAADVDESHFALGERDAEGCVAVAVVSQACMDGWLARLAAFGVQAEKLIPETLLLPYTPDAWTLLVERDCVNLRSAPQGGMTLDSTNAAFILRRAAAESEVKPAQLHAWVASDAADAGMFPDDLGVDVRIERLEVPPLAFLARQAHEDTVIDLLQGPYNRREQLGKLWRPWRPAAALLAVWVILQFGVKFFQHHELQAQDNRLREEISQIYLQTFPEAKRVVDARLQMQQHLTELRGGTGNVGEFLKLLAEVSGPTADLGGVEIDRLSYKEGELNIALMISDLQRLEQLKDRLSGDTHMSVQIQSATARDNRVEARLQIKGQIQGGRS
jgi:general secretion pathway protein L